MSLIFLGGCEYSLLRFLCTFCMLIFFARVVFCGMEFCINFKILLEIVKSRKLILPSFAALALLMAYAGHTTIIIPKPLVPYVGLKILDLGMFLNVEIIWLKKKKVLSSFYGKHLPPFSLFFLAVSLINLTSIISLPLYNNILNYLPYLLVPSLIINLFTCSLLISFDVQDGYINYTCSFWRSFVLTP